MKVGVISDTHLKIFPASLGDSIAKHFEDVDMILHAGDVVELGVLDFFSDKEVKLVAGNMDSWAIKERAPAKQVIPIEGFKVGLIHGWGSPIGIEGRIISEFNDIDILVYGHTHNASSFTRGGVLYFNPGSPTDKHFAIDTTIGILEIGKRISSKIITL
jgi:putative phosphoesterase